MEHIIPLIEIPEINTNRVCKIYKPRRNEIDRNFRKLYRFNPENVDYLVENLLPIYGETRGGAVSNLQKIKCFLRYVGDPGFQTGVGEDLGLNQSSVCRSIWYTCQHIATKADEWIKFPSTIDEMQVAQKLWSSKYIFPNAIGALDCTHIVMKKPTEFGDEYVNRKNVCSFNVQATVDANEVFSIHQYQL